MMGHVREFLSMFQLFNFWNWRLKSKTVGAHGQAWQKVLDREVNGSGEKRFVSGETNRKPLQKWWRMVSDEWLQ